MAVLIAPLIKSTSTAETEWDETKLMASLARLQEMHIQLRQLRNTFPTILQPLLQDHASPESLYNEFVENATSAAKKVTSFVSFIGEDQSRKVLHRAKESRAENKEGIKGWMVTQHADWLDHPSREHEEGTDLVEFGDGENTVINT